MTNQKMSLKNQAEKLISEVSAVLNTQELLKNLVGCNIALSGNLSTAEHKAVTTLKAKIESQLELI